MVQGLNVNLPPTDSPDGLSEGELVMYKLDDGRWLVKVYRTSVMFVIKDIDAHLTASGLEDYVLGKHRIKQSAVEEEDVKPAVGSQTPPKPYHYHRARHHQASIPHRDNLPVPAPNNQHGHLPSCQDLISGTHPPYPSTEAHLAILLTENAKLRATLTRRDAVIATEQPNLHVLHNQAVQLRMQTSRYNAGVRTWREFAEQAMEGGRREGRRESDEEVKRLREELESAEMVVREYREMVRRLTGEGVAVGKEEEQV